MIPLPFCHPFLLVFFNQAGSATGYFVTNTCKINIMCFGMFVEKRSVWAYGPQSRIVWNFISALKHTLALVTGKIKNRLLEMCASNVLNNCGIESWYWISGIIALFSLLCRDLPGTGKSSRSKRNVFGYAFVRIFFSADLGQFCAFFALIFFTRLCLQNMFIPGDLHTYNISLTISTTKRVNACWVSSHFGDEVVPGVL